MIDLTHTQSQSPIKNQPFSPPIKRQRHIHWNDTQTPPPPQPKQGYQKYRGGRLNGGRRGSSRC